jgi:hypothetical protein
MASQDNSSPLAHHTRRDRWPVPQSTLHDDQPPVCHPQLVKSWHTFSDDTAFGGQPSSAACGQSQVTDRLDTPVPHVEEQLDQLPTSYAQAEQLRQVSTSAGREREDALHHSSFTVLGGVAVSLQATALLRSPSPHVALQGVHSPTSYEHSAKSWHCATVEGRGARAHEKVDSAPSSSSCLKSTSCDRASS